ncbi:MAG: HNH endonuclease [Candidatus Competibacteraceae bacterium]|nr:HNH endonuclease [Candidatus Competibacteraceae bacterium]
MTKKPLTKFYRKLQQGIEVKEPDECWPWTRGKNGQGYGVLYYPGDTAPYLAHRAAYEKVYGSISAGLCVMHSCDNPSCCNPKHLLLGTHADNMLDKKRKGRANVGEISEHVRSAIREEKGTHITVAIKYGVSMSSVHRIRKERRP